MDKQVSISFTTGTLVKAIVIVLAAYVVWLLRDLLLLILTAIVIASAIEPGVVFFVRHRIPRIVGVLVTYLAVFGYGAAPDAHFELLLSDVVMPGMNGLSLAQALRATHPGMRELFMSGYSMDVIEERGFDTEGLRILAKPFHMADLLKAVQSTLQGA